MVDESGNPILDHADIDDCLPLETLTNLTQYRLLSRSRYTLPLNNNNNNNNELENGDSKDSANPVDGKSLKSRNYRIYSSKDRE